MNKIAKTIAKVIATLLGIGTAMVVLAGCKSIKFEKIERTPIIEGTNVVAFAEKIVRGEHSSYGTENNLEGFYLSASPTNGVLVKIERASSDMSKHHKEIIDSSGSAVGKVAGVAVGAALGTSAAGTTADAVKDALDEK